jgi:hypothetical protein
MQSHAIRSFSHQTDESNRLRLAYRHNLGATEEVFIALEPPHLVPMLEVSPVAIAEAILAKILNASPQGLAAGLGGWTYEHIKATTSSSITTSKDARAAVLRLTQTAWSKVTFPISPASWTPTSSPLSQHPTQEQHAGSGRVALPSPAAHSGTDIWMINSVNCNLQPYSGQPRSSCHCS